MAKRRVYFWRAQPCEDVTDHEEVDAKVRRKLDEIRQTSGLAVDFDQHCVRDGVFWTRFVATPLSPPQQE